MKPTLYYSPGSQHSRRVTVLANELDLDLDMQVVAFKPGVGFGDDAYRALNPNGKVPTLRDGDVVIWESNAIMWYLAERHGDNPLWPADRGERAQILKWQFWQAAHLTVAADGLFYENMVKPMMKQQTDAAAAERHGESFHRWAKVMDGALEKADYLVANRFTCADISIAGALMWAGPARIPIADHPPLAAWLERIQSRPSWKATEPPPMP